MSNRARALLAVITVALLAACAPKPQEVVYTNPPLTQEPVFHGKYGN